MTISQLRMLKLFKDRDFTYDQALKLDQRIFGSLCLHTWVDWSVTLRAFKITALGETVFNLANRIHNFRKFNNGKFSIRVPKFGNRMQPTVIRPRRRVA